jgi:hypothetical protein
MKLRPVEYKDGTFITKWTGERIIHKTCHIYGFWTDYSAEVESNIINNLHMNQTSGN